MSASSVSNTDAKSKWGIIGVIIGAIGASICCIGPLVLLALGIGGAWIGNLTAFEAYRPIFSIITLGFVGYAFYQVYRKPKETECAPGSACANPGGNRFNKISLWVVTVLALGLLAFPYLAPTLANAEQDAEVSNISAQQVELQINGMTCGSCAVTAQKSLENVEGVISAQVSFDESKAVVTYDPGKVRVEDLKNATARVGYPSTVQNK